jgi:hypothetical protein
MISYLKHPEIDKQKWDLCIASSSNGMANVNSWYLDIVSPGWEALVQDNYKAIMPVPLKRKYNIPYIIQPLFVQQLGIFSSNSNAITDVNHFLKYIPLP